MQNKQQNKQKGKLGEDIACKFLEKNGFHILARNYSKKWGELDIVAEKNGTLNFFEVKSVARKFKDTVHDGHKPEENVDGWKSRQIRRMIQTYIAESGREVESEFNFHVLSIFMDLNNRKASIKWIKDVIL